MAVNNYLGLIFIISGIFGIKYSKSAKKMTYIPNEKLFLMFNKNNPEKLEAFLERMNTPEQIIKRIHTARKYGYFKIGIGILLIVSFIWEVTQ